jgi:hypothetical protein
MRKSWEIQPGRGARILEGLGKDVHMRAKLGLPTPQLRAEAAQAEEAAEAIISRGIRTLAAGDTAITRNLLLNRLMVAEQKSLATTRIGTTLLDNIEELENKPYLESDPCEWRAHQKVTITPLVEDAVFWDVTSGWSRTRERGTRMLRVGEEREGRFTMHDSLISAPALGGQLTITSGWNFLEGLGVTVTGLVSPETGEPQVDLEVLARTG